MYLKMWGFCKHKHHKQLFLLSLLQRKHGDALGGPYIATHLRRQDFLYGHRDDVPSIKGAAKQLKQLLKTAKLSRVFVATDAPEEGMT